MKVLDRLRGRDVLDGTGGWLGTVVDEWPTDGGGETELVLVNVGRRFPRRVYLPVRDAKLEPGTLRVPYDRLQLDDAPSAEDRRWGDPPRLAKAYWLSATDD